MKISNNLEKIIIITFLLLGLTGFLHSNEEKNRYIDEHTPVFTSQWSYYIKDASSLFNPDFPYTDDIIGSFTPYLINKAKDEYDLYERINKFLGFSNPDSQIQIYFSDTSYSSLVSGGIPFGEPIPLSAGTHTVEGTDPAIGQYKVTVSIEKSRLDIKEEKSGYTRFDTVYAPADVFMVKIKAERM